MLTRIIIIVIVKVVMVDEIINKIDVKKLSISGRNFEKGKHFE